MNAAQRAFLVAGLLILALILLFPPYDLAEPFQGHEGCTLRAFAFLRVPLPGYGPRFASLRFYLELAGIAVVTGAGIWASRNRRRDAGEASRLPVVFGFLLAMVSFFIVALAISHAVHPHRPIIYWPAEGD